MKLAIGIGIGVVLLVIYVMMRTMEEEPLAEDFALHAAGGDLRAGNLLRQIDFGWRRPRATSGAGTSRTITVPT